MQHNKSEKNENDFMDPALGKFALLNLFAVSVEEQKLTSVQTLQEVVIRLYNCT